MSQASLGKNTIEFIPVSREIRSLIARRQELLTFLGTVYAATGIFLQNALQGQLPPALQGIERHLFAFYALMIMVPSLVLGLRVARLHGGMILNGVLYARLMQEQDFTAPDDPVRAARHNVVGVSFLYFVIADLLAGFSAGLLALTLSAPPAAALVVGLVVFAVWLAYFLRAHDRAAGFALAKIRDEPCVPVTRDEWEVHVSASLEDANRGLIADLGFLGLMVFSTFEVLSGLGDIQPHERMDLAPADVQTFGPALYAALLLLACVLCLAIHVRVRVAIGRFSLQLDPTDRPFRPLRLTDSLLGYLLEAFFLALALHLFLVIAVPPLSRSPGVLLAIDAAAFAAAVVAEQATLVVAGRRVGRAGPPP